MAKWLNEIDLQVAFNNVTIVAMKPYEGGLDQKSDQYNE